MKRQYSSVAGWRLTVSQDPWWLLPWAVAGSAWLYGPDRFTLDGLRVTPGQAQELLGSGRRGQVTLRADCTLVMNGVELSAQEAQAVRDGRDPLEVLMTGLEEPLLLLRARPLTEKELLA